MADVNYVNPSSMYPLQTGDAHSPAFGAGTVPGSFMAGMMLPERMDDYRKAFDTSMTSSNIANRKSQAELQDYLDNSGLRGLQRQAATGELTNQIAQQPDQRKLQTAEVTGKIQKALNALPEEERRARMSELTHVGGLLQQYKDKDGNYTAPPQIIAADMKKQYGIDIDSAHVVGLGRFDPAELKAQNTMSEKKMEQEAQTLRERESAASRERVAAIMAKARTAAGTKPTKASLMAEQMRINSIPEEDRSYAEQKFLEYFPKLLAEISASEADPKAKAAADAAAGLPAAKIDVLTSMKEKADQFDKDPAMKNYTRKWNQSRKKWEVFAKGADGKELHIGDY